MASQIIASFDVLFFHARQAARKPAGNSRLTQEHLAGLIGERLGTGDRPVLGTISNWEKGRGKPKSRALLVAAIWVLVEWEGLKTVKDVNALLASCDYAALSQKEANELFGSTTIIEHEEVGNLLLTEDADLLVDGTQEPDETIVPTRTSGLSRSLGGRQARMYWLVVGIFLIAAAIYRIVLTTNGSTLR